MTVGSGKEVELALAAVPRLHRAERFSLRDGLIIGAVFFPMSSLNDERYLFMAKLRIKPPKVFVRRSEERGHLEHGWLNTYHTFSFAGYYDHRHMGFRTLRVINEDRVAPGEGFGLHPHKDMEILSYVISGALKHKDSLGHETVIKAGSIQKITAGSGIIHGEFNASSEEPVHFLQVWITPSQNGLEPSYAEVSLPGPDRRNPLLLIGAPDGSPDLVEGVTRFYQDVRVYRLSLIASHVCSWPVAPAHGVWLQMVTGALETCGTVLYPGDGLSVEGAEGLRFTAKETMEALVFELA